MAVDFSKFDKSTDLEGLKNDIAEVASNGSDFKEVPYGSYEIEISKLELTVSKEKQNPMLSCWMKIVEGEYKGSMIFMNQVVVNAFGIHFANEFLRSLVKDMDIEIKFESYSQYSELILDVAEEIDGVREYLIEYGENKGFNTFKIKKYFELEE